MDVDSFITARTPDWQRLDDATRGGTNALVSRPGAEISDTIRLYLQVSTDLTYVRTRYADRRLERYLNDLVNRARQAIYAARPGTARGFASFFGARYRNEIRRTAPFIIIAAALTIVVVLITWFWIAHSPDARLGVIPPQAQEAIQRFNGNRNADLGPSPAITTEILVNNVRVAFLAFALGITLGIGTVYLLIQNGMLLGLLAGAFAAAGHGAGFWSLILPHGLLELTAIFIAAGAGMRMGWAIVEPGDRARTKALAEEATAAVVVVLGVVPAFVLAAMIEGFVTGTTVPHAVQLAIGIVVAGTYWCFLFGWWPGRRRDTRRPRVVPAPDQSLPADLIAR
jgi:uncharacterized membrane protein SpoIIM required for sporulation